MAKSSIQFACPKCNQAFIGKGNDLSRNRENKNFPLIINCGHSICRGCAESSAKDSKYIICSTCHGKTELEKGEASVNSLLSDLHVLGRLAAKDVGLNFRIKHSSEASQSSSKSHGSSIVVCDECSHTEAVWRCDKCVANFCNVCFDAVHKASRLMKKHEGKPIIVESYRTEVQEGCPDHDQRPIEFYCEDDEQLACSYCVVLGKHKEHSVVTLVEKNKACSDKLKMGIEEGIKVQSRLQKTEKRLTKVLPDRNFGTSHLYGKVLDEFHRLHSFLQLREAELAAELDGILNRDTEMLEDMRQRVSDHNKELSSIIKDAQQALNNSLISMNVSDVIKKLNGVKDLPCYLVMTTEENVDIKMNFDSSLVDTVKSHGKIESNIKPKYALKNEQELPPDYDEPEDDMTTDSESVTSFGESSLEDIPTPNGIQLSCLPSQNLPICSTMKQENVYVTHIHHPSQFWVQKSSDARKLKALTDSINKWCASSQSLKFIPSNFKIGELYLVQFEADKSWYRGRVKKILNTSLPFEQNIKTVDNHPEENVKAEVFYIDFGNTEIVPITRFRHMQPRFLHILGFAMECCLWDIVPTNNDTNWSEAAVKMFATFVANRELLMVIIENHGDLLSVDLSQPGEDGRGIKNDVPVSVRDALIFMEVGCFVSGNVPEKLKIRISPNKLKMRQFYPPEPLPIGKKFNALLSHAVNPRHFYVQQMGGNARYLSKLIFNMQKQYNLSTPNDIHTIYAPKQGMICVCQYSVDKQWYRARVIGLPGGAKVEVLYIDFGNTEIVTCKSLRKIMDDFVKLPCQAIKCSLIDVAPMDDDDEWSAESNEWFTDAAGKKELSLKVHKITPGEGIAEVTLYHIKESVEICLNGLIVKEGFAKSTGPESTIIEVPSCLTPIPKVIYTKNINTNVEKKKKPIVTLSQPGPTIKLQQEAKQKGYFAVTVSHVDSPDCIYLHRIEQKEQLERMMAEMQKVYNQSQCSQINITQGKSYAVVHPVNKHWYRGHITKVLENKFVQVHFVDYGFIDLVSMDQVQPLLQQFVDEVIFSVRCRLDGIIPAGGSKWSHIACETLKTLVSSVDVLYLQRTDRPADAFTLPVELFIKQIVSSALEVTSIDYKSISEMLIEKGVALPKDRLKRMSSLESEKNGTKSPNQEENTGSKTTSPLSVSPPLLPASLPPEPVDVIPVTAKNYYIRLSEWKASENPEKTSFIGIPSHVGIDGCIYFHIEGQGSLELIKNALQMKYNTLDIQPPISYPSPGEACIAKFCVDRKWYRAVVTKVEPPDIEVMFVDYGNLEIVRLGDIRTDIILGEMRCQAFECLLHGIETISEDGVWPTRVLDFIHNTIVEQKCNISVVTNPAPEERLQVKLELAGGLDLAGLLVQMKEAKKISKEPEKTITKPITIPNCVENVHKEMVKEEKEAEPTFRSNLFIPATLPKIGIPFPVIVTQVLDYNMVFIQRHQISKPETESEKLVNQEIEKFLIMMAELSEKGDHFEEVDTVKVGKPYCGMYTYDGSWYRCVANEVKDDAVLVSYIDYGNCETLPIDKLRQLPKEYFELPHQAVICKIRGIEPVGDNWADEIASTFATAFFPKEGKLIARVSKLGCPVEIDLMLQISDEEPKLAYQHLIDNGLIEINEALME